MVLRINSDYNRFKEIVRGHIKKELRKYMSTTEIIQKKGGNVVSIPLPYIELPRFRYGDQDEGGVGQGEGDIGTSIGKKGDEGSESEGGRAGNMPGEHAQETEVTIEELAHILGEELALPKIAPKGKKNIESEKDRYTSIHKIGPESLRHFKRTFKEALKRQIVSGYYDYKDPVIVPIKEDKRYRSWKPKKLPESNALIIYMMDVSGSMGDEQKEIVRIEAFWINTWLKSQYRGLEAKYIVHDAVAREVDEETFFRTKESGGTIISSAYKLCVNIIENEYSPDNWNIYPFHFSDGDNWSGDDTSACIELLKKKLIPYSNIFSYGQVESQYGSGQFIKDLEAAFSADEKMTLSKIENKEDIYRSIKDFLSKGR